MEAVELAMRALKLSIHSRLDPATIQERWLVKSYGILTDTLMSAEKTKFKPHGHTVVNVENGGKDVVYYVLENTPMYVMSPAQSVLLGYGLFSPQAAGWEGFVEDFIKIGTLELIKSTNSRVFSAS
eukprot:PhF_6_TR29069/c0_g1_i1/m.42363